MIRHRILSATVTRGDDAWVQKTMLVRRGQQIRSELDEHKWYESEKAGCDIGLHRATISYVMHQALLRRE